MSFVRPEARAALARWRDTLIGLGVLALGLYWATRPGLLAWVGYAVAVAGAALALIGLQRARFLGANTGEAAGVIELDERQLSYFGVGSGTVVPLGAVVRIEVETTDHGPFEDDLFWRFTLADGTSARIPGSALGNERLFDALSEFPGADYSQLIAAAGSTRNASYLIWARPSGKALTRAD